MRKTLGIGFVFLLIVTGLIAISACAKKVNTIEKEPEVDQAALDRQKELQAERQRKEAEQRRYQAAKRQFINDDIYFEKGSYQLQPEARTILFRKAEFLKQYPDVSVIIEGHTDERGSRETNIAFGERRAGAVVSFLIKEGIERSRLTAVSFGKESPVNQSRTTQSQAKNRRVHFVIQD
jgi:peptidoglycan-associated lipoprotein